LPFGPITLETLKLKPYKNQPSTLGEHLKKRRLDLGLFQIQVANRLGVSQHGYIGWELDRKKPEAQSVPPLINFLGYSPFLAGGTLGQRLRCERRSRGLTQRRAAAALQLDEGTYLQYERDEWLPKGERLKRIEAWLS
jgi:transcriptional regulator with XRE-family HTH domain